MLIRIAIFFALLVLVVIAAIYGRYFFSKAANERAAIENVNEQHAAADIEGYQAFQSRVSSLHQLGILGEKVAESKADTCYIHPSYSGFSTATYEQFCQLDFVAGYTATLAPEKTFTRLQTLPKDDQVFPINRSYVGGCMHFIWPTGTVSRIPRDSMPEGKKGLDCRIPDLVNGISFHGPQRSSFDYTFVPSAIDQSVDLIWVTYLHRYYRENIGCRPGLFCSSPRDTPIQAD
jgi:hypothetical protein